MISREDRAYCAGLFEGEGSVFSTIRKVKNKTAMRRFICLSISMTDSLPLDLFGEAIGAGSIRGPFETKSTVKPQYTYRTDRFEIVQFIVCNIWDWLSPRRKEQCIRALNTYTSFKLINKPMKLSRNNGSYR